MKNNIYKFLLILPLLLTFSSCEKYLEQQPQNGLIRENFWQTKEQLQSAVIGVYSSLLNNTLVTNLFVWGELRADMVDIGPIAASVTNETDMRNDNILSTNSFAAWASIYTTINYCNTVIEFGPGVIEKDPSLTQQSLNASLAEVRAIRGLMYFYLLRIWGEVPLQLTASTSDSKIVQLPKSSKEDVYKQIKEDLDFAAANTVTQYVTTSGAQDDASNKGRINLYTVNAIQADVALWMDKYDECIAACDKVINSQRFGLLVGDANWFRNLYVNGNSNESIFEFQYSSSAQNAWVAVFANTSRKFQANFGVVDMFGFDPLNPLLVDIRGDFGSYRGSDGAIWKHVGIPTNSLVTTSNSTRHWFVYRYADVLLMKAEALAWTNKGADALVIVNDIRTRAKAIPLTAENPDPNSAVQVSDYIFRERGREFAFEGKRWFDLLRQAKRNNYAHLDLMLDVVSKVAPADKIQAITNKLKDTRSHYMPVALSELQADKLLVQNPFYQ